MSPRRERSRERGVVLIWMALFLVFMLGFVALGIDTAKLMATKTELQNAADAAALAGASALNFDTGALIPDTAVVRAQIAAAANRAFTNAPTPVQLLAGDISFPAPNEIKVVTRRDPSAGGSMITHVAQVLGIKSIAVSATATAKAESSGTVCESLVPMGAIPPPGEDGFAVGCGNSYQLYAGQGGSVTGNYQMLSFPQCDEGPCEGLAATGANTMRCLIANGYSCCVGIGDVLETEPGNMNGPFRQGLQDRFDQDAVRTDDICYSDYQARGGTGQRVVNVPIIESLGNGRTDVRVIGFSAFFLKRRPVIGPSQPLYGEFLYNVAPGSGGGGHGTLYSIRLVR